jgi:PadR family transcriptional regulator PadR
MCVLALVGRRPHYGYELTTALSRWQSLATTEGTLYPLLRRLQRDGCLEAIWQESAAGPPRKYYRLTTAGEALLRARAAEWDRLAEAVDELRHDTVEEDVGNGPGRESPLSRRAAPTPAPTSGR